MAVPWALIGSIGSAALNMMGSNSSQKAQQQIAMYNAAQQQRESFLARAMAERMLQVQLADQTDARGNRVTYRPGVGFTQDLSDRSQSLVNAADRAELSRLTDDEYARQQGVIANFDRRLGEGNLADALMSRLLQPSTTRKEVQADLHLQNRANANAAYDQPTSDAILTALRGDIDPTKFIQGSDASRSRALGGALANAISQSRGDALQFDQSQGAFDANLYNMFAGRASNYQDTPFAPNSLPQVLAGQAQTTRNTSPQAFGIATGAAARPGGRIDPTAWGNRPDMALGFGSIADALGGYQNEQTYEDRRNQQKNRW